MTGGGKKDEAGACGGGVRTGFESGPEFESVVGSVEEALASSGIELELEPEFEPRSGFEFKSGPEFELEPESEPDGGAGSGTKAGAIAGEGATAGCGEDPVDSIGGVRGTAGAVLGTPEPESGADRAGSPELAALSLPGSNLGLITGLEVTIGVGLGEADWASSGTPRGSTATPKLHPNTTKNGITQRWNIGGESGCTSTTLSHRIYHRGPLRKPRASSRNWGASSRNWDRGAIFASKAAPCVTHPSP